MEDVGISHLFGLLTLWGVVLVSYKLDWIPKWLAFVLMLLAVAPLGVNGFLFPDDYMPDQFRYLEVVESIRNFSYPAERTSTVLFGGFLMAIVPIPWVTDVTALGYINRFLITVLIIWFYRKGYLGGLPLIFLLIYPDLILYSSLGLRDAWVLVFMLAGAAFLIQGRYLVALMIFSPLYVLKFQNFFLLAMACFTYICFFERRFVRYEGGDLYLFDRQIGFKLIAVAFLLMITVAYIVSLYLPEVVAALNHYRYRMFLENGGDETGVVLIENAGHAIQLSWMGAGYFLVKPLLFEATNAFQVLQSLVNLVVVCFLTYFTIVCFKRNRQKTLFWLFFILASMALYSLVVENFGTAARYRFPFIALYVFALGMEVYRKECLGHGFIKFVKTNQKSAGLERWPQLYDVKRGKWN